MEDTTIEDNRNINSQLPDKLFIKSEYVFIIDITNKKYDNIIATAVKNTTVHKSYFNNFNQLASKERD